MEPHQQIGTDARPVDPWPSASRRCAAGGALLAAIAALVVVVIALWGDLGWLLVAIVAFAGCCGGRLGCAGASGPPGWWRRSSRSSP
jgi:hypothetical protein